MRDCMRAGAESMRPSRHEGDAPAEAGDELLAPPTPLPPSSPSPPSPPSPSSPSQSALLRRRDDTDDGGGETVAVDCGGKHNIYRHLADLGCEVIRVGPDVTAAEIRESGADGLFISNGPGDPAAVEGLIGTLSEVAGELPTFGICLGHQLLALALGAKTWKLPFGHRGANQPVSDLLRDRVEITSQNHGFCVDRESLLEAGCEVTHVHLNDQTVAGFRHLEKPIFAVQFHPEASPGPHESSHLFREFVGLMDQSKAGSV